jgi:hypothetical protein
MWMCPICEICGQQDNHTPNDKACLLRQKITNLESALTEAKTYMEVMTNGPGDAPGMWLIRYKDSLKSDTRVPSITEPKITFEKLKELITLYDKKSQGCNERSAQIWWLAKAYALEQLIGKYPESSTDSSVLAINKNK